ncbi:MAG: hypothetical protein LWW79_05540 [Holophagaceae bacterium]|nr:hypothetical protein [Holophagaceae bacterium]
MRKLGFLIPGLLLSLALACGGASHTTPPPTPPAAATGLAYTDPAGTGWRLIKDPASTPTRLLLNLVGPSGLLTRGAGFNLKAPAAVRFGNFTETNFPIKDLGVYELWNTDPYPYDGSVAVGSDPLEPRLLAGGVKSGNVLTVGVFQKDRRATAKDSGHPLCQIALEYDAATALKVGDAIALTITKAKHIPGDIGAFNGNPTLEMVQKSVMQDMTVAVGVLRGN